MRCCGCFVSNDALLYLLLYAVTEVLAIYTAEASRLSFEGSICADADGEEEITRVAQATKVFGELPRASYIIDLLSKQTADGAKRGAVGDVQQKFAQTKQAVWASIRPLTIGWADLLAHE